MFARHLSTAEGITSLDMSQNTIDDLGFAAIAQACRRLTALTTLNFSRLCQNVSFASFLHIADR